MGHRPAGDGRPGAAPSRHRSPGSSRPSRGSRGPREQQEGQEALGLWLAQEAQVQAPECGFPERVDFHAQVKQDILSSAPGGEPCVSTSLPASVALRGQESWEVLSRWGRAGLKSETGSGHLPPGAAVAGGGGRR